MLNILSVGALLLANAGASLALTPAETASESHVDVAYAQLAEGEARAALVALEAKLATTPHDPAVLINLGSAYAMLGQFDAAEEAYRAAIASSQRYNLQLADGSWADSRHIALRALASLEQTTLAMR